MSQYRFLVVEDDPETLEFNDWVLRTEFDAEVVKCADHAAALAALIKNPGPWNCFIIDARTPRGQLEELFKKNCELHPGTPNLIISVGPLEGVYNIKLRSNDQVLPKAYDAFQLIMAVKKALSLDTAELLADYIPVRFESLKHLINSPCDLFVKINDQKYSRVSDQGLPLAKLDPEKYQKKGAPSLYCRRLDWPLLIPPALQAATTRMQMEALKTNPQLGIQLSSSLQELLQTTIRNFGWSDEVVRLAEENVRMVRGLIATEPHLRIFRKVFEDPQYEQAFIHSVLLSYVLMGSFKDSAHLQSSSEMDTLCLAAFLHDGFLEEDQIRNESQFVSSVILKMGTNKTDRQAVEKHPQAIYDLIKAWAAAPRNLASILIEHHERPDGRGFPQKLKSIEISRLSYAFIIAHEITEAYLHHKDVNLVLSEFEKLEELFAQSPYDFYKQAKKNLQSACVE